MIIRRLGLLKVFMDTMPLRLCIFKSHISLREPYFDGNSTYWTYRNPWRKVIPLNGTDGATFHPSFSSTEKPWGFVDDLSVTGTFYYLHSKDYFGKLSPHRFV
jgi:hypothetical protein